MMISRMIKISCLGLLGMTFIAGQAWAVPATNSPVKSNPSLSLAPKFKCSISEPAKGSLFQTTKVTLTQISGGTLMKDRKINVFWGNGSKLFTTACSSAFKNGKAVLKPVIIAPQDIHKKFKSQCSAKLTMQPCSSVGVPS